MPRVDVDTDKMTGPALDGTEAVAFLRFCTTRPGSAQGHMQIFPREQLDIGRNDVKNRLGIEELTISNHHLRTRCIVYEEDNEHNVAPMIYFRVLSFNSVELKRAGAGNNTGIAVSRGHGDILLSAGDVLRLTPNVFLQFHYHSSVKVENALDQFQRAEVKCFSNEFELSGRRLGVGGHASVYVAIHKSSGRQLACKAVPLPETDECAANLRLTSEQRKTKLLKQRQDLAREYTILEKLNHPNIVSLEKVICATYDVYIFQELIPGGDLLSYLDRSGPLEEPQSAVIVLQLTKAVDYLHDNGIAHRDIKPENVLMTSWRAGARVLLTDFGQSRMVDGPNTIRRSSRVFRMQSLVGTYGYTAPEIFQQVKDSLQNKGYSKAVDIWSIGCVTAALLTGDTLFAQDSDDFKAAKNARSESTHHRDWDVAIIEEHPHWAKVSQEAKAFVKGCLAQDEAERLTANQALSAEWLSNKHYAPELTAAYERAVMDWRPRKQNDRLVEFIDTTKAVLSSTEKGDANPLASQLKSRHFQNMQMPIELPPQAKNRSAFAPTKPQPLAQPPMFRNAMDTRAPVPPPTQFSTDDSLSASPLKAGTSMMHTNYTADVSTGPLSIWRHGPPQTQFAAQTQKPLAPHDSCTQSRSVLDEPTQSQMRSHAHPKQSRRQKRVVDSQETQLYNITQASEGPRKKVRR